MSAYMTPAGGRTRLASEKNLNRGAVRINHFTPRSSRTPSRLLALFWLGLGLSVMGSLVLTTAWLWMLAEGAG